jgi:type I restriction enzyme M protein
VNDLPKALIHTLSEDFLSRFAALPLIDRYDVYQRLMDYWMDVMQDDVYLIAADGWGGGRVLRAAFEKETPDFTVKNARMTVKYVGALIPARSVIRRFFSEQQAEVERLERNLIAVAERKAEFEERHGSDEGALSGLEGSKGITKSNIQQRAMDLKHAIMGAYDTNTPQHDQAKAIKKTTFGSANWKLGMKDEDGLFEDLDILYEYLQIAGEDTAAKQAHKVAVEQLYAKVLDRYGKLTEDEIKTLVIEDKWLTSLRAAIEGEVQRPTQQLAGRVNELAIRYAQPLPALTRRVEAFTANVDKHLKRMGLAWK